jgi:hypothetical protein
LVLDLTSAPISHGHVQKKEKGKPLLEIYGFTPSVKKQLKDVPTEILLNGNDIQLECLKMPNVYEVLVYSQ